MVDASVTPAGSTVRGTEGQGASRAIGAYFEGNFFAGGISQTFELGNYIKSQCRERK